MKDADLDQLAKQYLIPNDGLGKTHLIRRIQIAEGNLDCFATVRALRCSETNCRWREECQAEAAGLDLIDQ